MSKRIELSFWRLNAVGWSVFAIAMAASRFTRFPLIYMIGTKGVMAILGFLFSGLVLRPFYRRWLTAGASTLRVAAITSMSAYVGAIPWTAAHSALDIYLVRAWFQPGARLDGFWSVFGGTLYNAFTLLAWSLLYVAIRHQRALLSERERALRAESLAHESRLESLRWQLNPHFLFNALNAISTLVVDGRSTEAAAMIARLGDLLRSTLDIPGSQTIPLSAELELVRRYLDIEQIRLGERLTLHVAIADDAWSAQVPPLMLQPIVENAIRHAISKRAAGGTLSIRGTRDGSRVIIEIEDDGPGMPAARQAEGTQGIGLRNTRERLLHTYGPGHAMTLHSESTGTRVRIELPYRA